MKNPAIRVTTTGGEVSLDVPAGVPAGALADVLHGLRGDPVLVCATVETDGEVGLSFVPRADVARYLANVVAATEGSENDPWVRATAAAAGIPIPGVTD